LKIGSLPFSNLGRSVLASEVIEELQASDDPVARELGGIYAHSV